MRQRASVRLWPGWFIVVPWTTITSRPSPSLARPRSPATPAPPRSARAAERSRGPPAQPRARLDRGRAPPRGDPPVRDGLAGRAPQRPGGRRWLARVPASSAAPGASAGATASAEAPDWSLLDQAYQLLRANYVDQSALDPTALLQGAISGLMDAVNNPGHTGYLTAAEVAARDESLSGTFVGVGAVLDLRTSAPTIVRVLPGSPAEKAGLRAGEVIVRVDGTSVTGQTLDQVVARVRGPAGTPVTLGLQDPDGSQRSLTIVRATARPPADQLGAGARNKGRGHPARVVLDRRREEPGRRDHRGARGRRGRDRARPAGQPGRLRHRGSQRRRASSSRRGSSTSPRTAAARRSRTTSRAAASPPPSRSWSSWTARRPAPPRS